MYRVRIDTVNKTSDSDSRIEKTFEDPHEAVGHLRIVLKELEESFSARCEEHCKRHGRCGWCDAAAEVGRVVAEIARGTVAARLCDGKPSIWPFTPPGPAVIAYWIS